MQNGKNSFGIIFLLKVILLLVPIISSAQEVEMIDRPIQANPYKSFSDCESKSPRTSKPTVLKFSRQEIAQVKTLKNLLKVIPEACDVFCAVINLKMHDDKDFEFLNIGNDIVYLEQLSTCKFIVVEQIVTSCPMAHKANYKILFE